MLSSVSGPRRPEAARLSFPCLLLLLPAPLGAQSVESLWNRGAVLFDGMARQAPLNAGSLRRTNAPTPRTGSSETPTARPEEIGLGELAEDISQDPEAVHHLIETLLGRSGELGRAWASPERKRALELALREADKSFLDHFPVLSPKELLEAGKSLASRSKPAQEPPIPAEQRLMLSGEPKDPKPGEFMQDLGHGLFYGDVSVSGKASAYGDNQELALALNRLALNGPQRPAFTLVFGSRRFTSVGEFLSALLDDGSSLPVEDRRYFANFGDLRHAKGGTLREVRTPVWVDTGFLLSSGKRLVIPVTHSEVEISLRGRVNADLSFFFGIDGAPAFRADSTTNQRWVGGRTARSWSGTKAADLLERAAWVRRELKAKAASAKLPLGGYGPLGDCNDAHAFLTGTSPYPMLRDPAYFRGGSALDAVSDSLPYDLKTPPDPRRILDSLPFEDPADIPFPEVRQAVEELRAAFP